MTVKKTIKKLVIKKKIKKMKILKEERNYYHKRNKIETNDDGDDDDDDDDNDVDDDDFDYYYVNLKSNLKVEVHEEVFEKILSTNEEKEERNDDNNEIPTSEEEIEYPILIVVTALIDYCTQCSIEYRYHSEIRIDKQRIFVPKRTADREDSSGSCIYYVTWMRKQGRIASRCRYQKKLLDPLLFENENALPVYYLHSTNFSFGSVIEITVGNRFEYDTSFHATQSILNTIQPHFLDIRMLHNPANRNFGEKTLNTAIIFQVVIGNKKPCRNYSEY
ncbi:hypothetical protein ANN_19357 [Periplaneta americana]|uniref:Uncharacterized protein n=1 Tax=Periplaneta americana TaxID=6978 RepID=A0ABQ8S9N3_PERAM|nr:hypothetical protein ANN_19357 [Periplaneta americana]